MRRLLLAAPLLGLAALPYIGAPASVPATPCTANAAAPISVRDTALARRVAANVDTICSASRATVVKRPATRIVSLVNTRPLDSALRLLVFPNVDTILTHTRVGTATYRAAERIDSLLTEGVTGGLTVVTVSLAPSLDTVQAGTTVQLVPSVRDGSSVPVPGAVVTWATSASSVATVSASGLATAVGAGTATITGTSSGIDGTATIVVTALAPVVTSVTITPGSASLTVADTLTLVATARTAGGTVVAGLPVTWAATTHDTVASITVGGKITANAAGSATVTATIAGIAGTAAISVAASPPTVASVALTRHALSLTVGGVSDPLHATAYDGSGNAMPGVTIIWTTTASGVATVTGGIVTAIGAGTARIIATASAHADTCVVTVAASPLVVATVTVTPSTASLTAGGSTATFSAIATTSLGVVVGGLTTTWSSSATSVATVNSAGVVTPLAAGATTISATISGVAGTASVSVTAVAPVVATVTIAPSSASLTAGSVGTTLVATPRDAQGATIPGTSTAWTSNATSVATVTSGGYVAPIGAGSATITATIAGVSGTATITVAAPSVGGGPVIPALPQATVSTDTLPTVVRTVAVHAADNLQLAINTAARGDRLLLDSGATWRGTFTLPAKTGSVSGLSGWVTIASQGSCAPQGTRTDSGQTASMARIMGVGIGPAIKTAASASGYRLICLEATSDSAYTTYPNGGIVLLGDGSTAQNTLQLVPSNLVLDRVYVHGYGALQAKRCVALNSATSAIIDSYLTSCVAVGQDAQAILGWNGPGPFKIENNRLEGSGENVMFGGADPAIPNLIPSDITIRRNYFTKPLAWKAAGYSIKNLLELKSSRRTLVEGNVFENEWVGAQWVAVNFKSVNQSGSCPWCGTSDVTFRYNALHDITAGIKIAAHPETYPVVLAARILVEHNLLTNVGSNNGTTDGTAVQLLGTLTDVTIRKNTIVHNVTAGHWLSLDLAGAAAVATGITISDNVSTWGGPYDAIKTSSVTQGSASLAAFSPGYTYTVNAIIALPVNYHGLYPTTTLFAALTSDVFVAPGTDWHIKSGTPYVGLGADIDAILGATSGVTAMIPLSPGDNLATAVAAHPPGTGFRLRAGTYSHQSIIPKTGDLFVGDAGAILDGGSTTPRALWGWTGSAWANNVTVRTLRITHYASPAQDGAISAGDAGTTASGTRWLIDAVQIDSSLNIGLRIGDHMRVRHSLFYRNGTLGLGGVGSGAVIDSNEVAYNNANLANNPDFEAGGTKFVKTDSLTVRGNFVHHNGGPGLWTDTDNIHTLYEGNRSEDNAREGIVHEISYDAIIRNNIVQRNGLSDPSNRQWLWNAGIGVHASPNVEVYGNTVVGNLSGIVAIQQARGTGAHGAYLVQNLNVHDNTITQSGAGRPGDSNAAAGVVQDVSDQAIFTSRNNVFTTNTYTLGANTLPFAWLDANRAIAAWQGFGLDLAGIFH